MSLNYGKNETKEAGEAMEDGRLVTAPDGSGQVNKTTANSDEVYGVTATAEADEAGDPVAIDTIGPVREIKADGSISDGEAVSPAADGRVQSHGGNADETFVGEAIEGGVNNQKVKIRLYSNRTTSS